MTDAERTSGPLDIATLDVLARRAESNPLADGWAFRPDSMSPRRLELSLDADQYPQSVVTVRLDVRWFEGGDYTFHYHESHTEDSWQCRWDRHPKPNEPRTHLHPPPDAETVEESEINADHHLGILFSVLERVEARVTDLHHG
mgnify:CR=1 FL=1